MGALNGVVRRLPVATDLIYDYIPVDIVVNALIVAGYIVGRDEYVKFIPQFNLIILFLIVNLFFLLLFILQECWN